MAYIARSLREKPLFLLATYRDEEKRANLQALVDDLSRKRLARSMRLDPLSRTDLKLMLAAILADEEPVRPAFLDVLCDYSSPS